MPRTPPAISVDMICAAVNELGACAPGVLSIESLKDTPSQGGRRHAYWPKWAASVLVFGLEHPGNNLRLDRWGGKLGTPGNRKLIAIAARMVDWLVLSHGLRAIELPYSPSSGGIYLKEAAAKAGVGVIGKNNLLVTPEYGPHLRLRAILMDLPVSESHPLSGFDPCHGCDAPCRYRCPQEAFVDGEYNLERCRRQMQQDEMWPVDHDPAIIPVEDRYVIQYCRECDLSCPVGSN